MISNKKGLASVSVRNEKRFNSILKDPSNPYMYEQLYPLLDVNLPNDLKSHNVEKPLLDHWVAGQEESLVTALKDRYIIDNLIAKQPSFFTANVPAMLDKIISLESTLYQVLLDFQQHKNKISQQRKGKRQRNRENRQKETNWDGWKHQVDYTWNDFLREQKANRQNNV